MLRWLFARWRVRRRLGRFCRRSTALADLRRAWRKASAAERVRFLTEVEDLPY